MYPSSYAMSGYSESDFDSHARKATENMQSFPEWVKAGDFYTAFQRKWPLGSERQIAYIWFRK